MLRKMVRVTNEFGIHSKYALELVNTACKFKSTISLKFNGKMMDLKSIMGVMSLGVYSNEIICILVLGEDQELAANELIDVIQKLKIGELIESE